MVKLELRRCVRFFIIMGFALAMIPISARLFPAAMVSIHHGGKIQIAVSVFFFGFVVLLAINGLTSTLFKAERRSGALEYMLSLPQGKWQIMAIKMGVRVLTVLPFWLVFMVLARFYLQNPQLDAYLFPINHPLYMQFSLLFMLGSGFLLAAHEQRDWGAIVSVLLSYNLIFLTMALNKVFERLGWLQSQPFHQSGMAYALAVCICLLLLLYPFLSNMKRFDLRSFAQDSVLKKKAVPMLGSVLVLSILGLIFL